MVRGPGGTDGARMETPAASGVVGCAGPAARGGAGCCGARVGGARRYGALRGAGWRRAEEARLPRAALDIRRRAALRAAFLIYKLPPKAASL